MTASATCAMDEVSRSWSLYRGEQFDSDLGLYYLRARYYNPVTGRFMSRDPNDPGSFDSNGVPTDPKRLHKYLYSGGDPVNAIDPTGRAAGSEYVIVAIGFGLTTYAAIKITQCYDVILRALRDELDNTLGHSQFHVDWGEVFACIKEFPWHAMGPPGVPNPVK